MKRESRGRERASRDGHRPLPPGREFCSGDFLMCAQVCGSPLQELLLGAARNAHLSGVNKLHQALQLLKRPPIGTYEDLFRIHAIFDGIYTTMIARFLQIIHAREPTTEEVREQEAGLARWLHLPGQVHIVTPLSITFKRFHSAARMPGTFKDLMCRAESTVLSAHGFALVRFLEIGSHP